MGNIFSQNIVLGSDSKSMSVQIILPDESTKEFPQRPTVLQVAESIGTRLAKETVGARLNGQSEIVDLRTVLDDGTRLEIITTKNHEAANEVVRHSAAHVMAQAVQELWPEVKVTIGPVIDEGFYYDFHSEEPFTDEKLELIEKKMAEIIKRNDTLESETWSASQAVEFFENIGETFKKEIIEDLGSEEVTVYKQGEWLDLCRGPHVQRTGQIKAFKVLSTAGAYWRGDENREQLQRVYATAFVDKKDLKDYLYRLEEAKKRDHRKLGKDLGLFHFHRYSPASPFFTPKGATIYSGLQDFMKNLYTKYGYQEVITPQIFDVDLYKTSGHYDNYADNMYFTKIDERDFSVKPMNCPGHCVLYGAEKKSYRDLPWRIADFGRLHRYERSGVVHGLTRVRTFCQDDAHIFCTLEQMQGEIEGFMQMLTETYETLGMKEYKIYLSTRPEKRMGSDEIWDRSEAALEEGLKHLGLPYEINPGDGAFYGPKLDIMFVDALKRPWQLGTLQCDFNMPESFSLSYVGEDNSEHRPVMLHRAILGSLERFIGVYLEHTAGHLPAWLSPNQVVILNVTDRVNEYCEELLKNLRSRGIRVVFDHRNEKLNKKIREAQLHKVPYMVIVGDREAQERKLSLRLRHGETLQGVDEQDFLEKLLTEVEKRQLHSPFAEDKA